MRRKTMAAPPMANACDNEKGDAVVESDASVSAVGEVEEEEVIFTFSLRGSILIQSKTRRDLFV